MEKFKTVEAYINSYPAKVRPLLKQLRSAIRDAAPEADEIISYNMPAYKYHGVLVYFAAHTAHIGFYPGTKAVTVEFKNQLTKYKTSRGTIQFTLDKPIPGTLVKKIIRYRVKQNLTKAQSKLKSKKSKSV